MIEADVPECKGYKCWGAYGYEYDCDYESMEAECNNCICVTSQYGDYAGIDPRTGEKFQDTVKEKIK